MHNDEFEPLPARRDWSWTETLIATWYYMDRCRASGTSTLIPQKGDPRLHELVRLVHGAACLVDSRDAVARSIDSVRLKLENIRAADPKSEAGLGNVSRKDRQMVEAFIASPDVMIGLAKDILLRLS